MKRGTALLLVGTLALAGVAFLWARARGPVSTTSGEVRLFAFGDRSRLEGADRRRLLTVALGGEERLALLLPVPSIFEIAGVEVPPGSQLSFALGSTGEAFARRGAFELSVAHGNAAILNRRFEAGDFPSEGGWTATVVALPTRAAPGSLRFEIRAERESADLRDAVLLSDPTVRSQPRSRRLPKRGRGLIVFLVDTLRADRLSAQGYARRTSPRLDRFAAEGTRFANAYAPSSWTKPSVATLFTGLLPPRHGATTPLSALPANAPSLAEEFAAAGWRTGAFVVNPMIGGPAFGFDRGFEHFESLDARADAIADLALCWLERRAGEPFFLYLHVFDPHEPYAPPSPWDRRFLADAFPEGPPEVPTENERRALVDVLYDGEVAFTDAAFGRLLDGLDRLALARSTTVLFVSDHGEEFWDHGGERHGHTVYEELVRVPLVVRANGALALPAGVVEEPVGLEDLFPTLLRLAGRAASSRLDGRDLVREARRGRALERLLFHETDLFGRRAFAVRQGFEKYVESIALEEPMTVRELFDVSLDPRETRNLLDERPERAADLAGKLARHRAASGAGVWHLSFRSPSGEVSLSARVEAAGGIDEVRGEAGTDWMPVEVHEEAGATVLEVRPRGTTASIAFRAKNSEAAIRLALAADGRPLLPEDVRLGAGTRRASAMPLEVSPPLGDAAQFLLDPTADLGGVPRVVCRVWRFAPPEVREADLSPEELERFRALGYLGR